MTTQTTETPSTKQDKPRIFGPGYYEEVGRRMLGQGLEVCVGDELIPHAEKILVAKNFPDYPYNERERKKMRFSKEANSFRYVFAGNGGQWAFQHNLFVRDKGIFVVHDRQVEPFCEYKDSVDTSPPVVRRKLYVTQLEEKLKGGKEKKGVTFSPDNSIRFAPWDTLTEVYIGSGRYFMTFSPPSRDYPHSVTESRRISAEEIPNDGFIIASFGVLGAKILAKIAERTKSKMLEYWTSHAQGIVVHDNYTLGVSGNEWSSFYNLYFSDNPQGSATAK